MNYVLDYFGDIDKIENIHSDIYVQNLAPYGFLDLLTKKGLETGDKNGDAKNLPLMRINIV